MYILSKYNAAFTLPFALHALDGQSLQKSAVHATGDTLISKDGAADGNTTNGFVDQGSMYTLTLTATEMQAARILVIVDDQTVPKAWLPRSFLILTYGNASAHIGPDLSAIPLAVNLTQINGATAGVAGLAGSGSAVVTGTAVTGTLTSTKFSTNLTNSDQTFFNRTLIWTGGALQYQAGRIIRFENTSGMMYTTAFTGSPSNTDPFVIV